MKSYFPVAKDAAEWSEDAYKSYQRIEKAEAEFEREEDKLWTDYLNSQIAACGVVRIASSW